MEFEILTDSVKFIIFMIGLVEYDMLCSYPILFLNPCAVGVLALRFKFLARSLASLARSPRLSLSQFKICYHRLIVTNAMMWRTLYHNIFHDSPVFVSFRTWISFPTFSFFLLADVLWAVLPTTWKRYICRGPQRQTKLSIYTLVLWKLHSPGKIWLPFRSYTS